MLSSMLFEIFLGFLMRSLTGNEVGEREGCVTVPPLFSDFLSRFSCLQTMLWEMRLH